VRPARLERHAQRLALAQQVPLADHLVEPARPQPLGQRRGRVVVGEEVGRQAKRSDMLARTPRSDPGADRLAFAPA
jgi:hypothetical protein